MASKAKKPTTLPQAVFIFPEFPNSFESAELKCDGCKQVTMNLWIPIVPYHILEENHDLKLAKRLILCTTCGHTKLVK